MCIEEVVRLFCFSSRRRHTTLQGDWSSDVCSSDLHVQLTHRLLAFLLLLHLIGVVRGFWRRRDESRTVARAATIALGLVVLQFIVAASMVLLTLPAVLRSLHEAVGVSVWLSTFTYAYLARVAAGRGGATRATSLGDVPSYRLVGGEM